MAKRHQKSTSVRSDVAKPDTDQEQRAWDRLLGEIYVHVTHQDTMMHYRMGDDKEMCEFQRKRMTRGEAWAILAREFKHQPAAIWKLIGDVLDPFAGQYLGQWKGSIAYAWQSLHCTTGA